MKKSLKVIQFVFLGAVIIISVGFIITFNSSDKLVCKSKEGNITILYNNDTLVTFKSEKIYFDLDSQKEYVKKIGVEEYLENFTKWFEDNTSGTCKKK